MKECMKILIKHINFPVFPVLPSRARFSVFTLLYRDVPYDIKSICDQGDTEQSNTGHVVANIYCLYQRVEFAEKT